MAPISAFVSPSTTSPAICASCARQRPATSRPSACAPSRRWPAAPAARGRRTPRRPSPSTPRARSAAARGRRPAAFPPQPFAVEELCAGELDAHAGAAQPFDRLAVQRLGGGARRRAAHACSPRPPAPSRCRWPASSPRAAPAPPRAVRSCPLRTAASTSSASAHLGAPSSRGSAAPPGPRPRPLPRTCRGRCTARRGPTAPRSPRCLPRAGRRRRGSPGSTVRPRSSRPRRAARPISP